MGRHRHPAAASPEQAHLLQAGVGPPAPSSLSVSLWVCGGPAACVCSLLCVFVVKLYLCGRLLSLLRPEPGSPAAGRPERSRPVARVTFTTHR